MRRNVNPPPPVHAVAARARPAARHTETVDIAAAGGIVFDPAGRLLLVRRARPPEAGRWSIPGGKCRHDEEPRAACERELFEETGLAVAVIRWAGRVQRPAPDGHRLVIDDYICTPLDPGAAPRPGDDAAEVGWFDLRGLAELPLVHGLLDTLEAWELLPR